MKDLGLDVLVSVARWEREVIAPAMCSRTCVARCVRMGSPRLGWSHSDDTDQDGHRIVEPIEHEAETVALILDLKAQGLSIRKIASQLQAEEVRTKNGGRWHATTVRRILTRERATSGGDGRPDDR